MKIFIFCSILFFLSGCTTLNSNPQYSHDYTQEIENLWQGNIEKLSLKNNYTYEIASAKETTQPNIPEIKNHCVYLPTAFINYTYKYYYNNRLEIFTCLFSHEIAHEEFNLPDQPVETHYLVDKRAIGLSPTIKVDDYYNFLVVLLKYTDSVKGIHKHLFNTVWNVANTGLYAYAGFGSFGDWFAYDVKNRIFMLLADNPNIWSDKHKFFKRSSYQRTNLSS